MLPFCVQIVADKFQGNQVKMVGRLIDVQKAVFLQNQGYQQLFRLLAVGQGIEIQNLYAAVQNHQFVQVVVRFPEHLVEQSIVMCCGFRELLFYGEDDVILPMMSRFVLFGMDDEAEFLLNSTPVFGPEDDGYIHPR
mgnify:CR=1 FL=1